MGSEARDGEKLGKTFVVGLALGTYDGAALPSALGSSDGGELPGSELGFLLRSRRVGS